MATQQPAPVTTGGVIHWAFRYDLLITLLTLGREGALRERLLDLGHLLPGESVLDVGCGTGTLAIAARRRIGASAELHGVDPSPEMIARAIGKAKRAGVNVTFQTGIAESLPFPDARFDVVLSTVMLHHLRGAARHQGLCEMRRVLKPGGRLLAVDFSTGSGRRRGLMAHFHGRGRADPYAFGASVADAGFTITESGAVGIANLQFALGQA